MTSVGQELGENVLKNTDLLTEKAYSMKENKRNSWNLQSEEEGRIYRENWYNWIIHSSIVAIKDTARMMKFLSWSRLVLYSITQN